jgi:TolA-binding protein
MRKTAFILFFLICFSALTVSDIRAQVLAEDQPSVLREEKPRANYVYDLKLLIQRSRENIRNVNEKIKEQAVLKRNQQREEKAREYFLQAQKLVEEGRLEESRVLFDKAIRITEHPEMKYYIKDSEHRAKAQQAALTKQETEQRQRLDGEEKDAFERVESMYQGAVSLYKQQRYADARREFQTVEDVFPDYKAVRSYLQIIEQDIAQAGRQSLVNQKKEIESQQKEAEIARIREKELWRKEIDRKEDERRKQLDVQAQTVYDEAVRLYQDRKYSAARDKFQEVELVLPDFKSTHAYMQRIGRDIESDKTRVMEERQKTIEKQRWDEVLAEKKQEEERRKALELREREKVEQKKDQAEFVYQSAIAIFDKGALPQARDKFSEVEAIYPDYKSTRDYLKRLGVVIQENKDSGAKTVKSDAELQAASEMKVRQDQEKEKLRQRVLEAEKIWADGLELYKKGQLIEAKSKFLAVDQKIPDYKSVRTYLKSIDQDLSDLASGTDKLQSIDVQEKDIKRLKDLRDKAEIPYNQAIVAYNNKDFGTAKLKFQEVEGVFPNYKKTISFLTRIDDDIRRQAELPARQELEKKTEAFYAQALSQYGSEQFESAKSMFVRVATMIPDYKQTAFYLERLDDDIIHKKESVMIEERQRQAELLYNKSMSLYQAGEFEQAKVKLLELEQLDAGYKDSAKYLKDIDQDILRQRTVVEKKTRADKAEQAYQQAVALYQSGDYAAAKESFVNVEVIYPDYREVPRYLSEIDKDIERKKHQGELQRKSDEAEPLYLQAQELYKAQQFSDAKAKFLQVQLVFPGYKDTEKFLDRVSQDVLLEQKRLAADDKKKKVDAAYKDALKLYADRKFEESKKKFIEAASIDPDYRNVRSYLGRIDADIHREEVQLSMELRKARAERAYAEAVNLYHSGSFEAAKRKFSEVATILPDYKNASGYLSRVDNDIRQQKKEQVRRSMVQAELKYAEGQALLRGGDAANAYQKFLDVEALSPDYKSVRKFLVQSKEALTTKNATVPDVQPSVQAVPSSVDDDTVLEMYKSAVNLYKNKMNPQATAKFEEIQRVRPGFRSTHKYLDALKAALPKPAVLPVEVIKPVVSKPVVTPKVVVVPKPVAVVKPVPKPVAVAKPVVAPKPVAVAKPVVVPKVVQKKAPLVKLAPVKPVIVKPIVPVAVVAPEVKLEQKKQLLQTSRTVEDLSRKSDGLYRQIRALADDKDVGGAVKTFAQIDRICDSLEIEKRRLSREIQRQEEDGRAAAERARAADARNKAAENDAHVRQMALKEKQEDQIKEDARVRKLENIKELEDIKRQEHERLSQCKEQEKETRLKAEVFYQQALSAWKDRNYSLARQRFADAQKVLPGYKDSDSLLVKLERAEGEQKLVDEEKSDRAQVAALAEKANAVNRAALLCANARDFVGLQSKFDELSSLLREIQVIKGRMLSRRDAFKSEWAAKLVADKKKADRPTVKDMKMPGEGRTARQHAEFLYKEGVVFYNAGQYLEARVKFRDSYSVDSSFKPGYTFAQKVDRIIERRDFEDQQTRIRNENRLFEKKAGVNASGDKVPALPDPARARQVLAEGLDFYRAKHFKEARIKFEELAKVGDARQAAKSRHYLDLIDAALDKERQNALAEKKKEEERYLESKRAEIRLAWEKDRSLNSRQEAEKPLPGERSIIESRRKETVGAVDAARITEQKKMLAEKRRQDDLAARQARVVERRNTAVVPGQPDAVVLPNLPRETPAPVPTDVKSEMKSRAKIASTRPVVRDLPLLISATDERERSQFGRVIEDQRRAEARDAALRKQKIDAVNRAKELEKMRLEEKNRREEAALLRRHMQEVKASALKTPRVKVEHPAPVKIKVQEMPAEPVKLAVSSVPDPVQAAAREERRKLEEQRALIARDFEAGVGRLYTEAIGLYNKKIYDEARNDFNQVNGLIPGYKKTARYLALVEKKIRGASVIEKKTLFRSPSAAMEYRYDRLQSVSHELDAISSNPVRK